MRTHPCYKLDQRKETKKGPQPKIKPKKKIAR